MMETKAMISRSIRLYVLEKSMISTRTVVSMAPQTIGISKSISKAIAPPKISASEVEMDASTALPKIGRETHLGVWIVAASLKQRPVTIPYWAT